MSMTMATSSLLSAPPSSGNNNYRLLSAVQSTSTSYLALGRSNGSYYNFLSLRSSIRTRNKYIVAASNEGAQLVSTALSNISSALTGREGWIAGLLLALFLPFLKDKWGPLLLFKDKLDADLQRVEEVVETVEEVAEGLDKAAHDLAENLPEGSSLKNAVIYVEHAVEEVTKDAHLAELAIGKFHELEEEAEAYVKSQSDKGSKTNEGEKAKATIEQS